MAQVKIYNSCDCLIFEGTIEEYKKYKEQNYINGSDRVVFE